MNVELFKRSHWEEWLQEAREPNYDQEDRLKVETGGGTYFRMEGRVSKLEAYVDAFRNDVRDIKGDVRALKDGQAEIKISLAQLPTKADLETSKWQWVGISLSLIAVAVAAITGGLSFIAHAAH